MGSVAPAKGKVGGASGLVSFIHAANEHVEAVKTGAVTVTPGATTQFFNLNVPSFGFLRNLLLIVTTSGGVAGSGAFAADAPYNVFSEITLLDTNGAPLYGPLDGYSAFLTNKYGGYVFQCDPAAQPDANLTGVITFAFILRIPVEINANSGFGSLGNMNSAASYKVRLGINTVSNIYSVVTGLTAPVVNVDIYMECWTPPDLYDAFGRPQETEPPSHGTSQAWSKQTFAVNAGANQILLTRMGNLLRNVIFVVRTSAGIRQSGLANMPNPLTIQWDSRQMFVEDIRIRRAYMAERYQQVAGATGPETGVLPYSYMHDVLQHAGDGGVALYIPTVQATRFELDVTNILVGQVDILVNDVLPVEADPRRRYIETSASGFHPEVGTINPRMQ